MTIALVTAIGGIVVSIVNAIALFFHIKNTTVSTTTVSPAVTTTVHPAQIK